MEERTKRKRKRNSKIHATIVFVGLICGIWVLPLIGTLIWYNTNLKMCQKELNSYSPDLYEYLFRSVNLIFREDEGVINLNAKPEDIIIQEFEWYDSENMKCKLCLENGNIKRFFPVPDITVEISPKGKIIYTESAYSSKENLTQAVSDNIKAEAPYMGMVILMSVVGVILVICVVLKIRGY